MINNFVNLFSEVLTVMEDLGIAVKDEIENIDIKEGSVYDFNNLST